MLKNKSLREAKSLKDIPENYDIEHIIDIVYAVAGNIYYRKAWPDSLYSKEDFIQEAAMYMITKWDEGYFEGKPASQIIPSVIGMLNNWFIRNKHMQALTTPAYRKQKEVNIQGIETFKDEDTPTDKFSRKVAAALTDPDRTPDESSVANAKAREGKQIIQSILETMSSEPYPTRKHTYSAHLDGPGEIQLSPYIIAKLVLDGYTTKEIINMFIDEPLADGIHYTADSRGSYISKRVNAVVNQLADKFNSLDDEKLSLVKAAMELVI